MGRKERYIGAKTQLERERERERANDTQKRISPLSPINLPQLLEHNLHLLPIGRAHGDEMKALGILHLVRRVGFEKMRHLGRRRRRRRGSG